MKRRGKEFQDLLTLSPSASVWQKEYTLGLSARKTRRKEEVTVAFAENPAFDGTYDTFQHGGRGSQPLTHSIDASREPNVSLQDESVAETKFSDDANSNLSEVPLDELPSTTLRKVKGLARPGSVRHRTVGDDGAASGYAEVRPDETDSPDIEKDMRMQRSISRMISTQLEVDNMDALSAVNVNQMTLDMNAKKTIRRQASKMLGPKRISRWKQFKYSCSIKFKSFKDSVKDSLSFFDLWQSHLRRVQGVFGTGVLSYFRLLRWLFWLNVLITALNFLFLFIPQVVYDRSTKHNNVSFTGLELITGEGWFRNTELYYGRYTSDSIPVPGSSPYSMPLAYLFVGGGYLMLCFIILLQSMAVSYRDNFISGDDSNSSLKYFSKLFCSWDFAILNASAALLKQNSIYNDLVESLEESRRKVKRNVEDICILIFVRMVTNIIVLALISGSIYIILVVSDGSVKVDTSFLQDMLPAITISGINLIIPFAFRIIASLEQYRLPQTVVTVSLARTIVLKLASISVYVVALHKDVTCSVNKVSTCRNTDCWETFVGTAFYKLVLVDFVFILIAVFFGEFVRRILAAYIPWFSKRLGLPGFDISRNVLDLIYSQGICWLGAFYAPLLPLINVIKLFLLFYIKRYSVSRNCRPSMRPFNASKMNLLFLALLGLALLLAMIVIGYVIINSGDLKPSPSCGPFRGKSSIYSVVISWIDEDFPDALEDIVETVSSASILAAIIFLLGLLAYYFKLKKASGAKKIKLLKEQIALSGRDKLFLIKKLKVMMSEAARNATVAD